MTLSAVAWLSKDAIVENCSRQFVVEERINLKERQLKSERWSSES